MITRQRKTPNHTQNRGMQVDRVCESVRAARRREISHVTPQLKSLTGAVGKDTRAEIPESPDPSLLRPTGRHWGGGGGGLVKIGGADASRLNTRVKEISLTLFEPFFSLVEP